jgi:hypothetical protein
MSDLYPGSWFEPGIRDRRVEEWSRRIQEPTFPEGGKDGAPRNSETVRAEGPAARPTPTSREVAEVGVPLD